MRCIYIHVLKDRVFRVSTMLEPPRFLYPYFKLLQIPPIILIVIKTMEQYRQIQTFSSWPSRTVHGMRHVQFMSHFQSYWFLDVLHFGVGHESDPFTKERSMHEKLSFCILRHPGELASVHWMVIFHLLFRKWVLLCSIPHPRVMENPPSEIWRECRSLHK